MKIQSLLFLAERDESKVERELRKHSDRLHGLNLLTLSAFGNEPKENRSVSTKELQIHFNESVLRGKNSIAFQTSVIPR